MRLQKEVLHNFRGIKKFTFTPAGQDVTVRGRNGTGKTTLDDAVSWLLFGKDSRGQTDFNVKSLDTSGAVLDHGADHSVECTFNEVPDAGQITLKKVLKEKWTKNRGKADAEFSGHTVSYFVDGVPKKEREYKDIIAGICDEEKFRLLTNPLRFAEDEKRGGIGWKKRREILHELHPVEDRDVIISDDALKPLLLILGNKSPEDYKAICKAGQTAINKELPLIPARIDELTRTLAENDSSGTQQDMSIISQEIANLEREKVMIESGGAIADLTRQLAEVETKIAAAAMVEQGIINRKIMAIGKTIDGLLLEDRKLAGHISILQDNIEAHVLKIFNIEGDIEHGKSSFTLRRKESHQDTCDKCGQPLPADSLSAWNKVKSESLLAINAQITAKIAERENAIADRDELQNQVDALSVKRKNIDLQIKIEKIKLEECDQEKPHAPAELTEQKNELSEKIGQLREGTAPALAELQGRIKAKQAELATVNQQLAAVKEAEKTRDRIEELKLQERDLADEYEKLQQHLFLLEEFTRVKVRKTEGTINRLFEPVQFKMFETLINGGLNEICEVTLGGIPFVSDLNNGGRIKAGCHIIRVLQKHYNFYPVLFLDNFEGYTEELPELKCQTIKMLADEKFDKLTVTAD